MAAQVGKSTEGGLLQGASEAWHQGLPAALMAKTSQKLSDVV